MAKPGKRRRKARPKDEAPSAEGAGAESGSTAPSAATPSAATPSAGPKKKRPARDPSARDSAARDSAERRSHRATEHETVPPEPPVPASKPWWIAAVLVAVIAVVAYVRYADTQRTAADVEDVELDRPPVTPERLRVEVVHTYPHQRDAFTQGLLWHDGHLYESTGLRGQSTLRKVDLETGEVLERRSVEDRLFAEGLARVGDRLVQLTWQAGEAHVWSVDGFRHQRTFAYDGEGWGLCYDGTALVMSDGSDRLTFRDPNTFRVQRVVRVREEGRPLDQLNELECVDGVVWANVWQTDRIVRIDPTTGTVTGTVDARGLLSDDERWVADVLNGIAWIPERHHFVITGKHWPSLFEVDFVPEEDAP